MRGTASVLPIRYTELLTDLMKSSENSFGQICTVIKTSVLRLEIFSNLGEVKRVPELITHLYKPVCISLDSEEPR